jgi:hypothetical protein
MGDLSQEHGLLRASPSDIRKTARLALMQSEDLNRFKHALTSRYDRESLSAARPVIAAVLAERGLLGRIYVDSTDYDGCHKGGTKAGKFVAKYAREAKFVVAKPQCSGCSHAHASPTGGGETCSVFHKEIKVQVPYTQSLAEEVEAMEAAKGKAIQASSTATPKERIRLAVLASGHSQIGPSAPLRPKENTQRLMGAAQDNAQLIQASRLVSAKRAAPIVALLRREMLKGRSENELVEALKLAFAGPDLERTREHWEPMFREAGLFGVVYSTQDAFSDCHEGADFIAKHNPSIKVMVAGSKCTGCIHNKISRCLMYGKPLVKAASDALTPQMVETVLTNHKSAGRIAPWDSRVAWGSTPREALKNLHNASSYKGAAAAQPRDSIYKAFTGTQPQHVLRTDARREIVASARRFLNEGIYGRDLTTLMGARFEPRDLAAAADELRPIIAENQGLQGIYFVDPTVYADYGRGCDEAARLHRTRGVPYIQAGSKCGSCVLQTASHCSKINKKLVADVPYNMDKRALQQEILSSGGSTENDLSLLVNNGHSMMAEYEVQNRGMDIELDPIQAHKPFDVSFK